MLLLGEKTIAKSLADLLLNYSLFSWFKKTYNKFSKW